MDIICRGCTSSMDIICRGCASSTSLQEAHGMADLAYKVGRGKAIICEKCITTNKNLFSCSLELLILARVEIQKGVLEQKLLKLELD